MLTPMNAESQARLYSREQTGPKLEVLGPNVERAEEVLTPLALQLLASLHRRFNARRLGLLEARARRQALLDDGALPEFLTDTAAVRAADWRISPVPADLADRRVEITGPVDRKMVINALNAPVQAFMADFEDSCSPTWENLIRGQVNLNDAVRRTISYDDPATGKVYRLAEHTATLIVRPRGWHLPEKHLRINGDTVSGALCDFALFLANNHEALARRGTGPYFYLPKIESHLEARLWNEVFLAAQEALGIARGTIKATVLIETVLAAFEMDEILYELREHSAGLNCGRWDYIFSFIKKFRNRRDFLLPDRATVTMDRHFLKSYVELLIKTCHRRGAHAMGGMAAQIPIRDDPQANEAAMARVRADKLREARAGHDGTWIAHPGLAGIAREAFDAVMSGPNQLQVLRAEVNVTPRDLLTVPEGEITEAGLRACIRVGVQYLESWLRGNGCVPLYHLMEDAATAEICRAQLWQWLRHGARTSDGQLVTVERFDRLLSAELDRIHEEVGAARLTHGVFPTAARLFEQMTKRETFDEFLTLPAYELLS
jgi:malate synthase